MLTVALILGSAVVVGAACWLGPALIRRLPVPEPSEEDPAVVTDTDEPPPVSSSEEAEQPVEPAPPSYVALADRPGLAVKLGAVGAVTGAVVAYALGPDPVLGAWLYLAAVGVVLAYVDTQARLLPTRLIAPSYAVVAVGLVAAAMATGHPGLLVRVLLGWLAMGGFYFVLWFVYPKGLGYGDVRLSGLLGGALAYLGWAQLLTGLYAGFLVGGIVGGLLSLVKVVDRRHYPFGPFMLVGAVIGLLSGPAVASWYTRL